MFGIALAFATISKYSKQLDLSNNSFLEKIVLDDYTKFNFLHFRKSHTVICFEWLSNIVNDLACAKFTKLLVNGTSVAFPVERWEIQSKTSIQSRTLRQMSTIVAVDCIQ